MSLSRKVAVAVVLMFFVCTETTATQITHDWTIGGWLKNGIGLAGFTKDDGSADTEFRYGRGMFDYFTFPFHIYWIPVIAFVPMAGIGLYLYAHARRKQAA